MNAFIILTLLAPMHIILIIAVVLLLFGGKKIPQLMRGLGSGINEFKKGMKEGEAKPEDKDPEKLN